MHRRLNLARRLLSACLLLSLLAAPGLAAQGAFLACSLKYGQPRAALATRELLVGVERDETEAGQGGVEQRLARSLALLAAAADVLEGQGQVEEHALGSRQASRKAGQAGGPGPAIRRGPTLSPGATSRPAGFLIAAIPPRGLGRSPATMMPTTLTMQSGVRALPARRRPLPERWPARRQHGYWGILQPAWIDSSTGRNARSAGMVLMIFE